MKTSTTARLLEPFGHCGLDRNGKLLLGVEVVSCLDGKPRDPSIALDIIFVVDVSGSMASSFGSKSKLVASIQFAIQLSSRLEPGDTVSVATFNHEANLLLFPTKISEDCVEKVRQVTSSLTASGGTNVLQGLNAAKVLAQEAKKLRKDQTHESRVLLLTDMNTGEVMSAKTTIKQCTTEMATEGIHVSYIGIGEDFNQDLTEEISVAEGSNYFSILNEEDFEKRIVSEIPAALCPVVRKFELLLTAPQYQITGIYGAAKEEKMNQDDNVGWTRDTHHLFGEGIQVSAMNLFHEGIPLEIVGLITNEALEKKPVTVAKEASVFPSPSFASTQAGEKIVNPPSDESKYAKGGWIIITLEQDTDKGNSTGFVRFQLNCTMLDGSVTKLVKDFSLQEVEKLQSEGIQNWASSEGMEKAIVLKQYVDVVKEVLSDDKSTGFPIHFLNWWNERVEKFHLQDENQNLQRLSELLSDEK
eukprot:TRINITY_DN11643_c0_g1_i11.p1 TRINITY_DN11643_c0_g1~~TRINITY_DN11643_c0_g1_i11.p1  ORF type:complete len:472 (+),score=99.15 TRINITY_DN11643_c0_g1_i11:249-1664(+)